MNKLLVIINPKNSVEQSNVKRATTEYPGDQEGVKEISDTAWLIDPHTSFGTAASLVEKALSHHVPVSVFEVLDEIQ